MSDAQTSNEEWTVLRLLQWTTEFFQKRGSDSARLDAEILLAVPPGNQNRGVGTFILDHLEQEAASRGLNYLYNVVRQGHPKRQQTEAWLCKRGFAKKEDERLLRRVRMKRSGSPT